MGRHSIPSPGQPSGEPSEPDANPPSGRIRRADGDWQGRRRRLDGGRRGVSLGVIAALSGVVLLVGGIILWRFFGDALSERSSDAAQQCLQGTATVAVVADPSIAEMLASFADRFDAQAAPVGDKCVDVVVTQADSDAVLKGLTGTWPAELGERPALWLPASSVQSARLQAVAGKQVVSDARSLAISPVVLAVRPEVKKSIEQEGWGALPGLQNDPGSLDARNLPGWGTLRLALPATGAADANYLVAEAVAAATAPPNTPPTAGLPAVSALLAGQPRLPSNSAAAAWEALTAAGDPAAAPVHAVAMTEQQLFAKSGQLANAADSVAQWIPTGPVPLADYPTVLLSGPWLVDEQLSAASEFARFLRKDSQLDELAKAGFRPEGVTPEGNGVVDFPKLTAALPAGDEAVRSAVAGAVNPLGRTITIVMYEGLTGDEGGRARLFNVTAALRDRINAMPPSAAIGLWTFNKINSGPAVATGPLGDPIETQPRAAIITGVLDATTPTSGGGLSFTSLRAAYGDALLNYRPGQPNSVLVITQGPHTDDALDGAGLEDFIAKSQDPNRPLPINVISFGGDPDRPTWEAVTRLSGGNYQELPTSEGPDLLAAISRMLS
jgi:hypothetical protein